MGNHINKHIITIETLPENEHEIVISENAVKDGANIKIGDKISSELFILTITGINPDISSTIFPFNGIELHYGETIEVPSGFPHYPENDDFREDKVPNGENGDFTVVGFIRSPYFEKSGSAGYESEFGILQSEVYKVVALLREKYSAEKKQKLYMSDMLSDISHQIKTPLTAIQLMTELLEQAELDDEKRLQYAEKIDSQVTRITWLIRNLLTLSQLEAGVLEMKFNTVSLDKIVEQLHNSLDIMAELKGVGLDINIPHGLMINADIHWLREALMNLVKNCIEHTDEGGNVKISAEQNNLFTCLTVEDNGSGISEKDLPHIFERFYKAKNTSAQSVGIGLSLAKQIISAHNGTLLADSVLGEGTRFTLKLYRMGSCDRI